MMGAPPHINDDRHEGADSAADELYDAVLADLLVRAIRPPSVLDRLRSALTNLHTRRRADGDPLPPEHWFWSP